MAHWAASNGSEQTGVSFQGSPLLKGTKENNNFFGGSQSYRHTQIGPLDAGHTGYVLASCTPFRTRSEKRHLNKPLRAQAAVQGTKRGIAFVGKAVRTGSKNCPSAFANLLAHIASTAGSLLASRRSLRAAGKVPPTQVH